MTPAPDPIVEPALDPVVVSELVVRLGGRAVVSGVDLVLPRQRLVGVVGPNGSGKTTLLRAIFRGVRVRQGNVVIEGDPISTLRGRALARRVAAVVQDAEHPPGVTVGETIATGRYPHRGDVGRLDGHDRERMELAAAAADVTELWDRALDQLSGGERQRVHVARALAQETPVLLLDEPTNHLDIRHQFELLTTLRGLTDDDGVTVALAIHDLALAARFCDVLAVLDAGQLVAYGPPREVLRPPVTSEVFGVQARFDGDGRLVLDPL